MICVITPPENSQRSTVAQYWQEITSSVKVLPCQGWAASSEINKIELFFNEYAQLTGSLWK